MATGHLGCHGGAPADSQRYFCLVCCFELRLRGGEERLSDIEQDGRQGRLVCSDCWSGELRASMSELAVLLSARSERLGVFGREWTSACCDSGSGIMHSRHVANRLSAWPDKKGAASEVATGHLCCFSVTQVDTQRYFCVICCVELRVGGGEGRLSDIEQQGRQGGLVCADC